MGQASKDPLKDISLPCDQRYRTSEYFLEDQLRYSEAVSDFRSIKTLLSNAMSFTGQNAFRFQEQLVPVRID